jgi:hypothetical protein
VAECYGTPHESERGGRRRWVVAECRWYPHARARARAAEVGGGRVSWYPHARARARGGGGGWWPSVMVPPRESEREGRWRWVVAECYGTSTRERARRRWVVAELSWYPTRERAQGAAEAGGGRVSEVGGGRTSWYTPHAIASTRGCRWRGGGREGMQPQSRATGVRRWFWSASQGTRWFHCVAEGTGQQAAARLKLELDTPKKNPKSTTSCDMFNSSG